MSEGRGKKLIVGLGNPGRKYRDTRHNIGFWVIEEVAERLGVTLESDGDALTGGGRRGQAQLILAKPLTYVNRSGLAVQRLLREHDIQLDDLLVVVDDLHLDVGTLRMRPNGSSAGHNGVQDIINRLGSDEFPRLRIGIGDDYAPGEQADYVLSPFPTDQQEDVDFAVARAREAVFTFAEEGVETAMNQFNG